MEKLQETYNKNGMNYKLVKRNDKAAIYAQFSPEGLLVGYEVFIIRVQPKFVFPNGKVNPEKEAFPGNEAGGKHLWSYDTLESANKRYDEITNGILHPEYKKIDCKPLNMTTKVSGRKRGRPRKLGEIKPKVDKSAVTRIPKQKFVWEGKEYNSRSDVARILLAKDGSNKSSVAKSLNMTIQSVHAVWKKMK